ncbi:MAG TPA: hypothetical protein VH518_05260 [Tepidisphaeraceae bacterium]|jgi:hypothetical protein
MRLIAIIFSLCLCAACDGSTDTVAPARPRVAAGNGSIRGSVHFVGVAPKMPVITISNERCCEGDPPLVEETVVVNPNKTLRNVFVYLEDAPAIDAPAPTPALLDQVRCRYVPHAIGVEVDQPLRVRSSDPTMHNVHFMPEKNVAKNLSMTQQGQEVTTKFAAAEFIRFRCDVHPWMCAWVGVFENPFFAVTQEDGTFELKSIPAGTYRVVAWHELYGRREQSVTITDDKPIEVNFSFGGASRQS